MSKLQGSMAESIFVTECLKRKLQISAPIVDLYGYDFIISSSKHIKVQVKSVSKPDKRYSKCSNSFKLCVRHGFDSRAYINQFDFMAAYIIPMDLWYLVPIKELNKTTIRLNPMSEKCKFFKFMDNWDALLNRIPGM